MQIDPDNEGPYPLIPIDPTALTEFTDPTKFLQWYSLDLSLMHNTIIRAMNAIWLNAPLVLPEDEQAFIGYALATLSVIQWHHEAQENVVFPKLQSKIDMRKNMSEHLKADKHLQEFKTYLQGAQAGSTPFDMLHILKLRKEFGDVLVQHLHNEVDTFRPKYLYRCNQPELSDLCTGQDRLRTEVDNMAHPQIALERHKHGLRDLAHVYPFILSAHNRDLAADWPIVPASVKWLAQHVGSHIHREQYWKFAPYTIQGEFQSYAMREHHEVTEFRLDNKGGRHQPPSLNLSPKSAVFDIQRRWQGW